MTAADEQPGAAEPEEIWLGYDGLTVPFGSISAVLVYTPAWDRRIAQAHGSVPAGVAAVVLTDDGRVLPARRSLDDLHRRWTAWQHRQRLAADPDASQNE